MSAFIIVELFEDHVTDPQVVAKEVAASHMDIKQATPAVRDEDNPSDKFRFVGYSVEGTTR